MCICVCVHVCVCELYVNNHIFQKVYSIRKIQMALKSDTRWWDWVMEQKHFATELVFTKINQQYSNNRLLALCLLDGAGRVSNIRVLFTCS